MQDMNVWCKQCNIIVCNNVTLHETRAMSVYRLNESSFIPSAVILVWRLHGLRSVHWMNSRTWISYFKSKGLQSKWRHATNAWWDLRLDIPHSLLRMYNVNTYLLSKKKLSLSRSTPFSLKIRNISKWFFKISFQTRIQDFKMRTTKVLKPFQTEVVTSTKRTLRHKIQRRALATK